MKTIIMILSWIGVAEICFGQGTVNWSMISAAGFTAQTNATQFYGGGSTGGGAIGNTASASSGAIYYFELLYNTAFTGSQVAPPDYTTLFGGTWLDTGLTATNSILAGRLTPVNPTTAAVMPWASGVTNNIMMVGWSANLGQLGTGQETWLNVSNILANWNTGFDGFLSGFAFFGESVTGYESPNGADPGQIFIGGGANAGGTPIQSLLTQLYMLPDTIVTPEPSTFALAGLGGLSLLFFRVRRS